MARRIPSLNWLRVFEAAARTGSFARAAERLAMSPPAVSQQIRALEQYLGRPLFERAAAGVSLTEAGRGLLIVASDAIGRIEAAAEALANPGDPPVVIAVSQTFYTGWLAPRLSRFCAGNPNVYFEFRSLIGQETPPRDAALWIAFGQPPPGTDSVPLFSEELVPVAHPSRAAKIRSINDLLHHPLIEVADHRKNWAQLLGLDMLPRDARAIRVDTTLAALSLAASGCGLALARPPASEDLVSRFGLVPCLDGLRVPGVESYYVVWNSGAPMDQNTRTFKEWVLAEAAEP